MNQYKIAIIGLGLIGGSLARAFREKLGYTGIIAVDSDMQALDLALRQGIIAEAATAPCSNVYDADFIFICTPIKYAFEYIEKLAPLLKDNCIITDVCSTKEEITQKVNAMADPPCFIGGHPMAGTEKSGFANSYAHMFENAYYILTPCKSTTPESLEKLSEIIKGIGAIPIVMKAEDHDAATCGISHLPHVIAATLVNLVKELDGKIGKVHTLAAGGFRDITRIASSNPSMWENIVSSNKKHVLELVSRFKNMLDTFSRDLQNGDSEKIREFFAEAGQFRDSISDQPQGLIRPLYRIIVNVQDKPGIIGEIATILGQNNVNIKNINVANSREFEQGCLIITLSDSSSEKIAFDLLENKGYKVYKNR